MGKQRRKPHDPVAAMRAAEERAQRAALEAKAREHRPERWGEEAASPDRIEALDRHGVEFTTDAAGRIRQGARKADVWERMLNGNNLTKSQYNAVRRLEEDMNLRAGHETAQVRLDRFDTCGDGQSLTQAMVDAGRRVDDALALVGPPSSRILQALVGPDAQTNGRRMVRRCAVGAMKREGEREVRATCDALNDVHAKLCKACNKELPVGTLEGIETIVAKDDWRDVVARVTGEKNPMAQSAVLRQAAQSLADVYDQVEAREQARRAEAAERRKAAEQRAA